MSNYSYSTDEEFPCTEDESESENSLESEDNEDRTPQRTVSEAERLTIPPSSGPIRSSPVTGNAEQRKAKRAQKAQKKRQETFQKNKETKKREEHCQKEAALDEVLDLLRAKELQF